MYLTVDLPKDQTPVSVWLSCHIKENMHSLSPISCIALHPLLLTSTTTHLPKPIKNVLLLSLNNNNNNNNKEKDKKMGCFFSGYWFKSIISPRKAKKDRSKKVKVHSAAEKANRSKESSPTHGESGSLANGDLQSIHVVPEFSAEYIAAFRIQKAFRAYKARKAVHRLKGDVRFNVLIHGHDTQKQTSSTLIHIHSWSNIQAQIRARRHHMVTEGRIKQKKMENQLKLEAKLQELEVEWCGGSDTMEEILARIQQREEAAVKRERAMAYAFSHQWRANPTQYLGQAYYNLGKENWGWSWKERWIAARPWEIRAHAEPNTLKKVHSRQESKTEIKMPLSTKPALSNGKVSAKAKTLSSPTVDYQATQDACSTAGSSHLLNPSRDILI